MNRAALSIRDTALIVLGTGCEGCRTCQERAKDVAREYLALLVAYRAAVDCDGCEEHPLADALGDKDGNA